MTKHTCLIGLILRASCACLIAPLLTGCPEAVDLTELVEPPQVFADDEDPDLAALEIIEDQLLVQPYPGADTTSLASLYAQIGATVLEEQTDIGLTVLEIPDGSLDEAAQALADSGLIEEVHKNYLFEASETPNDSMFSRQSYLPQVEVPDAWDLTTGDEDVIVAVVDTGVDADHEDLEDKIIDGWNVYDNNGSYGDVLGHGTQVAGILAASTDNQTGIAGVAWESPIVAVRATDGYGRASAGGLAAGILWSVGAGASVINVSFAPLWSNSVVKAAAQQAYNRGVVVVISAGNGGGSTRARGYSEAMFVGAVDSTNSLADFSDTGPFVDIAAPGVGIRSTADGGGYRQANGTSFAAPIVSGALALAIAANPDLRPVTLQNIFYDSAIDLGSRGKDNSYGHGALDAFGAVFDAKRTEATHDDDAPTVSIVRPRNRSKLTGKYRIKVTAKDEDSNVADVVMSIDGVAFATDTRSPYQFILNTSQYPFGQYELSFVATDTAGNASAPESVTVTFGKAQSSSTGVTFDSHSDGARVSGNETIVATVADTDGLATVEWLIDGASVFVESVSGKSVEVSLLWRSSRYDKGTHTITIVATDMRGDQTTGQLSLVTR